MTRIFVSPSKPLKERSTVLSVVRSQISIAVFNRFIATAAVILMALLPVVPPPVEISIGGAGLILAALSWRQVSFHLCFFLNLFVIIIFLRIPYSQVAFALMIGLYLLAVVTVPGLRVGLGFFQRGNFGREEWPFCIGSAALSGAALLGWFLLTRPDLTTLIKNFLPNLPLPVLIFGGIIFAMVNALVEESVYRGVIFGALLESGLSRTVILPLQAVAFGTIHMNGFPSGWIGVGLASLYGLLMGLIRFRSGGLLAPWAGHVLTDLVIVTIVLLTG